MTPLLELADRVEAATGPDRELAEAVLRAVGWHVDAYSHAIKPNGERAFRIPDPLSSVDDAMALVPEGWNFANLCHGDNRKWWCELRKGHHTSYDKTTFARQLEPASPALAVTAAALRARASHTTT